MYYRRREDLPGGRSRGKPIVTQYEENEPNQQFRHLLAGSYEIACRYPG